MYGKLNFDYSLIQVSVATQVIPAKRPGRKPKKVELTKKVEEEEIELEDEDEEDSENIQVRGVHFI